MEVKKMRLPWKKRVRIKFDDESLKSFIRDMLGGPWQWRHNSMFQELTIDLHVADIAEVRREIYEWLEGRT